MNIKAGVLFYTVIGKRLEMRCRQPLFATGGNTIVKCTFISAFLFNPCGNPTTRVSLKCLLACFPVPHVDSGVERIDPLCFLAGCRKSRLNQAPSVLSLSTGFLSVSVLLLTRATFCVVSFVCVLSFGCSY